MISRGSFLGPIIESETQEFFPHFFLLKMDEYYRLHRGENSSFFLLFHSRLTNIVDSTLEVIAFLFF